MGMKKAIKQMCMTALFVVLGTVTAFAANAGQIDDIISSNELRKRIASSLEMLSMKTEFINL